MEGCSGHAVHAVKVGFEKGACSASCLAPLLAWGRIKCPTTKDQENTSCSQSSYSNFRLIVADSSYSPASPSSPCAEKPTENSLVRVDGNPSLGEVAFPGTIATQARPCWTGLCVHVVMTRADL